MGYMHIENTYRKAWIFNEYKELYALEKIHGTSAHIKYVKQNRFGDETVVYYSGGASGPVFEGLFDKELMFILLKREAEARGLDEITVYGEAYGGSMQKMSATYGKNLKFVVFDIQFRTNIHGTLSEKWLDVEDAAEFTKGLCLEFVHYKLIPATVESANAERDADSEQAIRNGVGPGKKREGVVLRPVHEDVHNGERVISKHKRDEFRETATPREINSEKIAAATEAKAIAEEWVTEMRLDHVLDKFMATKEPVAFGISVRLTMSDTPMVLKAMVEDVQREAAGEIVWSDAVLKAIQNKTRALFQARVKAIG